MLVIKILDSVFAPIIADIRNPRRCGKSRRAEGGCQGREDHQFFVLVHDSFAPIYVSVVKDTWIAYLCFISYLFYHTPPY